MRNFLSEDQIEKATIQVFEKNLDYRHLDCFTKEPGDLNDSSERTSKTQVVFPKLVRAYLEKLNPELPAKAIDYAFKELTKGRSAMSNIRANKELYGMIRDGVRVEYQDEKGKTEKGRAKIIDFNDWQQNDYLVVSQLWIKGEYKYRRPDLIVYVNGLPLIFIELKNSNVKLETAYTDNLTNYRSEIPQLFHYNAITILSNGLNTRVGSFNATWEHFGQWLRKEDEKEQVDRQRIKDYKVSLDFAVLGLCKPTALLDYVENFILFHNNSVKIIAKNHQFLGVNNAVQAFDEREERDGKLGVFWHTQGSGKSFSMIFFARKIFRKQEGNFTFLVITDRDDLDRQIYKNFLSTETLKKAQVSRPKNGTELRAFLKTNKRFIFTLIHKFRYPKGKKFPLLSERDDIIVIVDEAHRTQYATLAENLRTGLPNAQFMAFTGTPLLGRNRKTSKWFGEYVSEYNFAQAIADGATVPLFYQKRLPEVEMVNDNLNEELAEILEDENLTTQQEEKLEREFAKELSVIKSDDRLETIAADIAYHFPRRGYKGKGMVICVDKFTAVKMYDKVQKYWIAGKKDLQRQISRTLDIKLKEEKRAVLKYMKSVEMAIVISHENGEEERFEKEGLDIKPHRKRMNALDKNGHDVEYNFKDPENNVQLVFVCAMWLTGFDAPTCSTLYLDKPMKNHTLMQTIARVNRTAPGKVNGEIVDYYNVFRNIRRALKDYGQGEDADTQQNPDGKDPVQQKEELFIILQDAIDECLSFCQHLEIDLTVIANSEEVFENLELFNVYANKLLERDENRNQFQVYDNTVVGLYEACKPEILQRRAEFKMMEVIHYLRGVIDGLNQPGDTSTARRKISDLLDETILVNEDTKESFVSEPLAPNYKIKTFRELDLSKLDFDKLRKEFKASKYPNIEISDLRAFIEDKLEKMLARNSTRINFAEKLMEIINKYNSGGRLTEDYFNDLMNFTETLRAEEKRHIKENLTEEELELFDLLQKAKLTQKEKQFVKNAAQRLLKRLKEEKPAILIQDWFKDSQSRLKVKHTIEDILDANLPDTYNRKIYTEKCTVVFEHFLNRAAKVA